MEDRNIVLLAIQQTLDESLDLLKKIIIENGLIKDIQNSIIQLNEDGLKNQSQLLATYFNKRLKQLENDIKIQQNNHLSKLQTIQQKSVKNTSIKPFIVISLILLSLSIGSILYARNLNFKLTKSESKIKELGDHIGNFFDENPKVKKTYDRWKKR